MKIINLEVAALALDTRLKQAVDLGREFPNLTAESIQRQIIQSMLGANQLKVIHDNDLRMEANEFYC